MMTTYTPMTAMTMTGKAQWQEATAVIRAAQSVVVVTHISPDGDAIGSALGLANALREMGKQVTVANDDGVPDFVQFLPGADSIVETLGKGAWEVMISTDASDELRTGKAGEYARASSKTVINLDHHITNTMFGDIHLVVPAAVSATEIVFDWWKYAGHPLSYDVALPLMTGLVTDTIGFRISTVTARTLAIAQELMQTGVSLAMVTARTLDSKSFKTVNLWKHVMPSIELDGQVIQATVRQEDIAQAGLDEMTDGGLVSFLNTVNEANVAVVFKEQTGNRVELSIRSKPGFDVSGVAYALGGGGHKQAAGATVPGTLDEVRTRILALLQEVAANGKVQPG